MLSQQVDRLDLERKRILRQLDLQSKRGEWRSASASVLLGASASMASLPGMGGDDGMVGDLGADDDENQLPAVLTSDPSFRPVC